MIPELGYFALILALGMALIQAIFPLLGIWRDKMSWIVLAKPVALGQFLFLVLSFFCLIYAFVTDDFSVAYVAQNSNTQLPLLYKVAAVWGAHEGSVLLWVTILGFWTALVAVFSKKIPLQMHARVLAVLGFISSGFLLFLITTSSPFRRLLLNTPAQGIDLNPLLQDPGLASHPPMLYMGYVGFSVAFAFAIAALLTNKVDAAWARWMRPWTIAAWCFLTLGITLGSWWAYRVLGWGGWWFWDPVENASFLPWLAGTALIHSLLVTEKRGSFKSWTLLLAICVFSLSLVGTFLVRSGVLVSVHAFANDPARGKFLLLFLAVVIGCGLLLYALRAPFIKGGSYFSLLSRETFLLANNVLLIVAMTTILLGTLYPLIIDALGLGNISVGPPYFNAVFVPLMIPLLFLMGVGPLCYWREMNLKVLLMRLLYPAIIAVFLSLLLLLMTTDKIPVMVFIGLALACWVILVTVKSMLLKGWPLSFNHIGMALAHIGIAVCVIGITMTSYYKLERDVRMQPGDITTVGAYDFKFMGLTNLQGPNYTGLIADFQVTHKDQFVTLLHAQKRLYTAQQIPDTRAAIDAGIFRDLYVALGDPLNNNAWAVRIYYKPFVRWIWWGGLLMVLGGICALKNSISKRYIN